MLFTEIIAYKCKLLRGTKNIKNRIGLNRIGVYLPSHREVEQLVARRAHNPKVVGSSPALATKNKTDQYFYWSVFIYKLKYENFHTAVASFINQL